MCKKNVWNKNTWENSTSSTSINEIDPSSTSIINFGLNDSSELQSTTTSYS